MIYKVTGRVAIDSGHVMHICTKVGQALIRRVSHIFPKLLERYFNELMMLISYFLFILEKCSRYNTVCNWQDGQCQGHQ